MDSSTASSSPPSSPAKTGGAITLPLICLGIGLIACCVLIPQADENRRLFSQSLKLESDLQHLERQSNNNAEFLKRLGTDPILAERLAQRQMKMVRKNAGILSLANDEEPLPASPFLLATLPKTETPPPPPPVGGRLASLCRDGKSRLYIIALGLMLLASGLVLGHNPNPA